MLNILWPLFLIVSFVYGIFNGRVEEINTAVFDGTKSAVELCISLLGTMCLWNGIMEIAKKTSLTNALSKALKPFINFLFPELKNNKQAQDEISMNMVANLLGLGNAATPLGLKAMKTMQQDNPKKDTLTNSMAMFIVINTASLQLIPTNVIAIRSSLGSNSPSGIIIQVWFATIIAGIVGITSAKLLMKKF